MQSVSLAELAAANPAFIPAHLDSFRIVLDRVEAGRLWLAEVGLGPGSGPHQQETRQ